MHPIIFQFGFFTLRSFGLFMALAFAAAIGMAVYFNRKKGRPDEVIMDLAPWVMLGSVVGARLLYVVVEPDEYLAKPWLIPAVWQGGIVFYGGLAGGLAAALWWIRRHKLPLWDMFDVIVPGVALGQALGRVGCFFNGCCYGRISDTCGLVFPAINDNLRHLPVQLYESAACLCLFLFLAWFLPRRRFAGQVTVIYAMIYSALRFGFEFLRGDAERGSLFLPWLWPSQWIAIGAVAVAAYFWFRLKNSAVAK